MFGYETLLKIFWGFVRCFSIKAATIAASADATQLVLIHQAVALYKCPLKIHYVNFVIAQDELNDHKRGKPIKSRSE